MHGADRASQAYSTANKHHLHMNEEVELDEVLKPSMGAGAYIDDFVKSKNPKFAGKSADKRKQMALAAYYAAKKGINEESSDDDHQKRYQELVHHIHGHERKEYHAHTTNPEHAETAYSHANAIIKKHYPEIHKTVESHLSSSLKLHKKAHLAHEAGDWNWEKRHEAAASHSMAAVAAIRNHISSKLQNENFNLEAKDEHEYGYEGDMAMNQLKTLVRCAEMIEDCLKPDTDLPEWVQSKITLATDYIQTAADYLYSEMKESTTEADKYTIAEDNVDEAWVLRQKKKDKKTVKEESVKTFKDFLADINEVKMSDLPVRRIKGHSYGNQPEDNDDEDDEDNKPAMKKPESTEKRGRGRPAGAKSGAKQIGSAPKQKSGVDYSGYKLHLPNSNR
jgi:hypothetical protein